MDVDMNAFPHLGNSLVSLQPMEVSQAKLYADILSEESTYHFLTETGPVDEIQAIKKINANLQSFELGKSVYWSIVSKDGSFLGFIAVHNLKGSKVYLSYGIHPAHRRQGYGTMALKLALDWPYLADKEKEMAVHEGNEASFKMLSQMGLRYLGLKETRSGVRHIFSR